MFPSDLKKRDMWAVPSSSEFLELPILKLSHLLKKNKELGVELKWFGNDDPNGFTSNHKSWKYVSQQQLKISDDILSGLFDLRLPLTFSHEDCTHLSKIIISCSDEFIRK